MSPRQDRISLTFALLKKKKKSRDWTFTVLSDDIHRSTSHVSPHLSVNTSCVTCVFRYWRVCVMCVSVWPWLKEIQRILFSPKAHCSLDVSSVASEFRYPAEVVLGDVVGFVGVKTVDSHMQHQSLVLWGFLVWVWFVDWVPSPPVFMLTS